MKKLQNQGFNILELIIVMTIIILISAIVMLKPIDFQREQSLKNTTENIMALLNKAKSDSFSSLNSNNYGVHFNYGNMIYFSGGTFSKNDANNQIFNYFRWWSCYRFRNRW